MRRFARLAFAAAAILATAVIGNSAWADGFSVSSLIGYYAVDFGGRDLTVSPASGLNGGGVIFVDGQGNFKGNETYNDNGTVCNGTVAGTYKVGPNGNGVATVTFTPAASSACSSSTGNANLVVTDPNNVHFFTTDSTELVSGGWHRQSGGERY
jgi:hypothetical protein